MSDLCAIFRSMANDANQSSIYRQRPSAVALKYELSNRRNLKFRIKTCKTEVEYKNLQNRHPLSHPQHIGRTG